MITSPTDTDALITRHIANLRRLGPLQLRRDYLDRVQREDGKEFADRLRAAFAQDWEQRHIVEARE